MTTLRDRIESWGHPRILVIGDLMLDRYTFGDAERVSPEAPVLVLRADSEEVRPGGAASVAALLRGLETEVCIAGVIGGDASGRVLQALLHDDGIDDSLVITEPNRRTTTKERYLGRSPGRHAHQILRVDIEHRNRISGPTEQQLIRAIRRALPQFAAVLISDYAKGVCTEAVLRRVIDAARSCGIPIIVDPGRGVDYERYSGATAIKPNWIEAEEASGKRIATVSDAVEVASVLRQKVRCAASFVTLDQHGIAVCDGNGCNEVFPTRVREVCDITGAGDMVLAILGLCFAQGVPVADAAELANVAAGLEVERQGVALVTRSELGDQFLEQAASDSKKVVTLSEIIAYVEECRRGGKIIVFTNGCFDLLHIGHVTYLQQAAELGDVLIVAVNSDASIRRIKGPSRPIIDEQDRAAMLAALGCVSRVLIFDEDTPHRLLEALRPDVLVKGGTYLVDGVVGREVVEAYGGHVCVVAKIPGISTTRLVSSIKESPCE